MPAAAAQQLFICVVHDLVVSWNLCRRDKVSSAKNIFVFRVAERPIALRARCSSCSAATEERI